MLNVYVPKPKSWCRFQLSEKSAIGLRRCPIYRQTRVVEVTFYIYNSNFLTWHVFLPTKSVKEYV